MKLSNSPRNVFVLSTLLFLVGCASQPITPSNYSYDVYTFNLNESDFNYAKSFIDPKTYVKHLPLVDVSLAHQNKFWDSVNKFNLRESFVSYRYKFYACPLNLQGQVQNADECYYESESNNVLVGLSFESYQNSQAHFMFNFQQAESSESMSVSFDGNNRYPLIFVKQESGGQLFIIIKNHQNISWSNYKQTPQSVLQ